MVPKLLGTLTVLGTIVAGEEATGGPWGPRNVMPPSIPHDNGWSLDSYAVDTSKFEAVDHNIWREGSYGIATNGREAVDQDRRGLQAETFCSDPRISGVVVCNNVEGCACLQGVGCINFYESTLNSRPVFCDVDLTGEPAYNAPPCTSGSSLGDACSSSMENVDSGCATAGLAGGCRFGPFGLGTPLECVTFEPTLQQGCASDTCVCAAGSDSCACSSGVCIDRDEDGYGCDPGESFCSDPANSGKVCNVVEGCGCLYGSCLNYAEEQAGDGPIECDEDLTGGPAYDAPPCTSSSSVGDECSSSAEDIASGCATPGLAGKCLRTRASSSAFVCATFDRTVQSQACASDTCLCGGSDSCKCNVGSCFDFAATEDACDPEAAFCADLANSGEVCNVVEGCGCLQGFCLSYIAAGGSGIALYCETDLTGEPAYDAPLCTSSSSEGDECSSSAEDIDSGCATPGLAGVCRYPHGPTSTLECITYDFTVESNACATDTCLCPAGSNCESNVGLCSEIDATEYDCGCDPNESLCPEDKICCPEKFVCEVPEEGTNPAACGDPHMTGFLGQKFDFTGEDGGHYALIKDGADIQMNMRVSSPVPEFPVLTYITGLTVLATDSDGKAHSIVIEVKDPHNIESSCPPGVHPCLADGSLSVVLDGDETLFAPGSATLGNHVSITAVNIPGECRSFGFEQYWERKTLEYGDTGRRLSSLQSIGEWVLGDPTVTNAEECSVYVANAELQAGGLFSHQSEHASFKIVTPNAIVRLSHGRLHQVAMRDPTDQFDLPEHMTWQMNVGLDQNRLSHTATGILGETFVPTLGADGNLIMSGMGSIRGSQEDYRVENSLGERFARDGQ